MLRKYQKYILFLCLWGVVCCTFYFKDSLSLAWSQKFIPAQQELPAYQQASSASSAGRAVLELEGADAQPVKSGNASQKGSPGLQTALPLQSHNTSDPVKLVMSKEGVTSSPMTVAAVTPASSASKGGGNMGNTSANTSSSSSSLSSPSSTAALIEIPPTSSPLNVNGTRDDPKTRKLVCAYFTGRLGNELFEYASTLGLALSQNRTPVFLGSQILKTALKNFMQPPEGLIFTELEERCKKANGIGEDSCCKFKKEMTELDPQHDYKVGLYLQSYRYFQSHEAEIRKAVTFNDNIRAKADSIVKELRQRYNQSTMVGMHIRHGDMSSEYNQKLGYPLADSGYINKSMAFFRELYPNCTFVISSDSLDWVKEHFPKNYSSVHFLGSNEPAVDMTVLSSMDHVVTSFGSFSWWVGFLNGGKTVYMKNFIRANTYIGNAFNPAGKDYIYPGWIPL